MLRAELGARVVAMRAAANPYCVAGQSWREQTTQATHALGAHRSCMKLHVEVEAPSREYTKLCIGAQSMPIAIAQVSFSPNT